MFKVSLGHEVHVACRTEAKAKAAAMKSGAVGAFACDLSSLESVRAFADAWGGKPIDSLCLNAGKGTPGCFFLHKLHLTFRPPVPYR